VVPTPKVTRTRFTPPKIGCFRCLASVHPVSACRDPVWCRWCGASGHMEHRCNWLPRKVTLWPPRYPTILVLASRLPLHLVPFSIRDATATQSPSESVALPPCPLIALPPFPNAFDPLNLVTSSRTTPPDFHLGRGGGASSRRAPLFRLPASQDLPAPVQVRTMGSPPRGGLVSVGTSPMSSPGRRFPPPTASPIRPLTHAPPAARDMNGVGNHIPRDTFDEYESEELDSEGSPVHLATSLSDQRIPKSVVLLDPHASLHFTVCSHGERLPQYLD
jgi:hypothetical protein